MFSFKKQRPGKAKPLASLCQYSNIWQKASNHVFHQDSKPQSSISHPIKLFSTAEQFRQALLTHCRGPSLYHLSNTFCMKAANTYVCMHRYEKH